MQLLSAEYDAAKYVKHNIVVDASRKGGGKELEGSRAQVTRKGTDLSNMERNATLINLPSDRSFEVNNLDRKSVLNLNSLKVAQHDPQSPQLSNNTT